MRGVLINMMRNSFERWIRNLSWVDWDAVDEKSLYEIMDLELKVQHSDLKRVIDLMTRLSISPSDH